MNIALLQHAKDKDYVDKLLRLGDCRIVAPDHADLILGVAPEKQFKSAPVVHEIEFAYRLFAEHKDNMPVFIGVTGTNGKTTVTKLLATLLDCPAAGNIFGSELLYLVPENEAQARQLPKHIVVEVASAQCPSIRDFHPQIAIITNIRADHIPFHGDEESYALAKARIFLNQTENDLLIYNPNDAATKRVLANCHAEQVAFDVNAPQPYDIATIQKHLQLPGRFNLENALACVIAAKRLGLDDETLYRRLGRFKGVPQRMEQVGEISGAPVINNSVATNPDATISALSAMHGKGVLILGGIHKEYLPLDELLESVKEQCSNVVLYGRSADDLNARLKAVGYMATVQAQNFREAIERALELGKDSDYVLFSPTCIAYDMFKDTVERGMKFDEIVARSL